MEPQMITSNPVNPTNDAAIEVIEEVEGHTEELTKQRTRGGKKTAGLLLVNQALATLAFFGVGVNLVLFLTRVLDQHNAEAANSVSKWTGTVYMFSLIGAFFSDSYWGRYLTCIIFQIFFILGLGLLSVTSWVFLIKPAGCGSETALCEPASTAGSVLFYLSIYLIALGYGGHQPTLATFGGDQYDEKIEREKRSKEAFFCYFYFALNCGCLFSNTILVHYEDTGLWTLGFMVSLGSAVLALLSFLLGSPWYKYIKPSGNPIVRVSQVFVASVRKWNVNTAKADELYEVEGPESAIKGSRKILHSDEFRFLDKAATSTQQNAHEPTSRWKLCTVTQVEEVKCVLRMLPVWLCTIIYSVVFTQMASTFVEQGDVMYSYVAHFHVPAASMSVFDIVSVLVCTLLYRYIIVPLARRLSGNPKGLTEIHRMGIGLIIGMLSMASAGVVEVERLKRVVPGQKASTMSIFWQVPQYVLIGASEVFMYVGQLEFFNAQAPDGIKSFGSSLCMASMALGNYVSSLLVSIVMAITAKGDNPGWIPSNLNIGHLDRFFFLVAGLSAVDFVIYVLCAKWYKGINNVEEDDEKEIATGRQGIEAAVNEA